jgi:hypothetical protein
MAKEDVVLELHIPKEAYFNLQEQWKRDIERAKRDGDIEKAEMLKAMGIEGYAKLLIFKMAKGEINIIR